MENSCNSIKIIQIFVLIYILNVLFIHINQIKCMLWNVNGDSKCVIKVINVYTVANMLKRHQYLCEFVNECVKWARIRYHTVCHCDFQRKMPSEADVRMMGKYVE